MYLDAPVYEWEYASCIRNDQQSVFWIVHFQQKLINNSFNVGKSNFLLILMSLQHEK